MMMNQQSNGSMERLLAVNSAIAKAAKEVGRKASDITLIAVSKTFAAEDILPVLESGHRDFGENEKPFST